MSTWNRTTDRSQPNHILTSTHTTTYQACPLVGGIADTPTCITTEDCATQPQAGSKVEVGYWPGRVDKYFDLYVASVWNTVRMARVLLHGVPRVVDLCAAPGSWSQVLSRANAFMHPANEEPEQGVVTQAT